MSTDSKKMVMLVLFTKISDVSGSVIGLTIFISVQLISFHFFLYLSSSKVSVNLLQACDFDLMI